MFKRTAPWSTPPLAPALALLALAATLWSACAPAIGNTCETNVQCNTGNGEVCDVSVEGGYCTLADCVPNGCPSNNAVCVRFDDVSAFCMVRCEDDSDCRDGHTCRDDLGRVPFCYIAAPQSPAPSP